MSHKAKLVNGVLQFRCPGCGIIHGCKVEGAAIWSWDHDLERPTLSPSVLIRVGHFAPGHTGDTCWCTWNAEHPDDPAPFKCAVCHSFVVDGSIQFLPDCTHALAGQRVPLPDYNA